MALGVQQKQCIQVHKVREFAYAGVYGRFPYIPLFLLLPIYRYTRLHYIAVSHATLGLEKVQRDSATLHLQCTVDALT